MKKNVSSADGIIELLAEQAESPKSKEFTTKSRGKLIEFYLSGEIEEPSEYEEFFGEVRHLTDNDVVKIYINSVGGDMFTSMQFVRVLRSTSATVIGVIEGACMSGATMIFLACDTYEVAPHCSFMIHNYSGGSVGKGGEMSLQLEFERKWSIHFYESTYEHFLCNDEIKSVLDGKDIWLTSEQVVDRLNRRLKARAAKAKEAKKANK